ncbi:unnamed protein product [Adineta ricciae]|uniref:G protein-coupled receptor n=1 Tax=Adineta ricciae TaxID=249248 RepID=A0A815TID6_ADIRI|nr:unnamed protein product [Adineta ricciae]
MSEFLVSLPFLLRSGPYCVYSSWMMIYLCASVIVVPSFVNGIFNIGIFIYVRSRSRRVQIAPHIITNTILNNKQRQQQRLSLLSRREISLLRHMIFMFIMIIGGWGQGYFLLVIGQFLYIPRIVHECAAIVCELAVLTLTINLFMCNHDLRQHLFNKLRGRVAR